LENNPSPKAVIFDLDGVLLDSRNIHFEALNSALKFFGEDFVISSQDHVNNYDGLTTTSKLRKLTSEKNLPEEYYSDIWKKKQEATLELFAKIEYDFELIEFFKKLRSKNIRIGVASNSIRKTVKTALIKLGLVEFVDIYLSNEDVKFTKPYPEIYWECMKKLETLPSNTVIFEDSHIGREAALNSGAHLIAIENRSDLNFSKIEQAIKLISSNEKTKVPWKSSKLNVLIPMAGAGSRFEAAGYTFPKPLIEVNGKPMIQVVVENLNIEANYIYIVQRTHYERYSLSYLLNLLTPNCTIVQIDGITEGAACTTLLAKDFINNSNPLIIANSDQFIEWNSNEVMYAFEVEGIDGGIVTFEATHPKWSFAKLNSDGFVSEVAEKKPISNLATVGVYYWRRGSDYVKYAEEMISQDRRVNNEFYVCPVYNNAIEDNKLIRSKKVEKMWGIGTPEDLNFFLEHNEI
jgi:HAD superfamily hydrolase (TIGR01509 family)